MDNLLQINYCGDKIFTQIQDISKWPHAITRQLPNGLGPSGDRDSD